MYEDKYKLLFQAVREGTVMAVQQAASRIFGSAVAVTDTAFRVLSADIDPGSTDDMLERKGDATFVSAELLELFREHDLIASMTARPGETIVVDWGFFSEHPHITTGIFRKGRILGTIVVLVDSPEYTQEQHEALQACAEALAMVIHANETGKKRLGAEREHFISKLFHGSASQKDLQNAFKNRFLPRSSRYIVLATDFTSTALAERAEENSLSLLLYQEEGISFVLAGAQNREMQALQTWIADRGHRFGLSYSFSDPLLTSRMAKQAAAVLQYGSHSDKKRADWSFPEHALDMLMKDASADTALMHPGILEIEQYDLENNTQYLETLRVWLTEKMDYSATAQAMHLHRNSLYYRMQRIRELFSINLDDMNTDVQLFLSLCVKE